ncbi:M12 family metallopeptidase [Limibacter armeniacum]|uniref:M12 family metallopeptidase n=1 Tax=Limibacter armeniacum TaxID=466084 RepID=UPI002FE5C2E6
MSDKKLQEQILKRLDKIEKELSSNGADNKRQSKKAVKKKIDIKCSLPVVPERVFGPEVSRERAELLRVISKKWVNGTILHYYFFTDGEMGGGEDQKNIVRQAFKVWKDLGIGLEFREVNTRDEAELRIGFLQNDGAWSYVGRDNLNIGQNERTMNFGWDLTADGEIDTALHEIGHAMGFPHEHQNANAGIVWNEEAVYRQLAGPPNFWSRDKTYWNIIRKLPPETVEGSVWDKDSIMHYPFQSGMILEPSEYQNTPLIPEDGLSEKDIERVRFFYPPLEPSFPELKPWESQKLSINVGEQKNFVVTPDASRRYNFQTFGGSDTVMVLFEEVNGELKYLIGDDDSGTDLNANFNVKLFKDRKYVLRIRLYYNFSSGDTAVMMW